VLFDSYQSFSGLVEVLSMMVGSVSGSRIILDLRLFQLFRNLREIIAVDHNFCFIFR